MLDALTFEKVKHTQAVPKKKLALNKIAANVMREMAIDAANWAISVDEAREPHPLH